MYSKTLVAVRDTDVSTWSSGLVRLTVKEVYSRFGIDIDNDRQYRFFWKIQLDKKVVLTDEVLDWMGYSSPSYSSRKQQITKLLSKNPHMKYAEIRDEINIRKKYYVLDAIDFESLMMQMRTPKAARIREFFSLIKMIATKYCEYENYFEKQSAELWRRQNIELLGSVNELKTLVVTVKQDADERERKAENERQRAEEREQRAQKERERAEERCTHLTSQIEKNITTLKKDIGPSIAPKLISYSKVHRLGLYQTATDGEWYLMRRQAESWKDAEKRLLSRSMRKVAVWENVPHAVDVGNSLKKKCRNLTWYAKGNIIRVPLDYRLDVDEQSIIDMINEVLAEKNAAYQLADENTSIL